MHSYKCLQVYILSEITILYRHNSTLIIILNNNATNRHIQFPRLGVLIFLYRNIVNKIRTKIKKIYTNINKGLKPFYLVFFISSYQHNENLWYTLKGTSNVRRLSLLLMWKTRMECSPEHVCRLSATWYRPFLFAIFT